MAGLVGPSSAANVWPRMPGAAPLGGANPNLPSTALPMTGNLAPPIPQQPTTPFPALSQPLGGPNNYNSLAYNPNTVAAIQNSAQVIQNAANQRRLAQLEEENSQRRNTTLTLQQMGTHLLQDQMNVQEQVLQYQFMLEQCLETLDHQNFVLNGQAEELALLRAKLRTFESFMDTIKHSQGNNQLTTSSSIDPRFTDGSFSCSRNLMKSFDIPPGSPFSPGNVTRVTSSKFQPFNPRYRSPNSRYRNPNASRSATPPASNTRLSRPANSFRN